VGKPVEEQTQQPHRDDDEEPRDARLHVAAHVPRDFLENINVQGWLCRNTGGIPH